MCLTRVKHVFNPLPVSHPVPGMTRLGVESRSEATGFSPFELMFGRQPRIALDVELGLAPGTRNDRLDRSRKVSKTRYVQELGEKLASAYAAASVRSTERKLKDADRRGVKGPIGDHKLEVGDWVLVRAVDLRGRHKLAARWHDTIYKVLEIPYPSLPVYKVQPVQGGSTKVLHRNLLLKVNHLRSINFLPRLSLVSS